MTLPDIGAVRAAAGAIAGVARRTPLERSRELSGIAGGEVLLKLETAQRTGSFKLRGALNALARLGAGERAAGVVTASAGNHGLGVALAARELGVSATVFVPEDAPAVKRERIAALGAELRLVAGDYDAAHEAAVAEAERSGRRYLHAFSDPDVVAGQGTVALEVLEDRPDVRTLLVPVGGGGLVGATGIVARAMGGARVVGVQTPETAAMHASIAAGRVTSPPMGPTLCDGLSGDVDGPSYALARDVMDGIVLVEEAAVARAIRWLYLKEGVTAEGSAAVAVAALLVRAAGALPAPIAVVVTGGNIEPSRLARLLSD